MVDVERCGVGLSFVLGSDGHTFKVKSVENGSPAAKCQAITKGDSLTAVDSVGGTSFLSVIGCSIAELKALLLGADGSFVSLRFRRGEEEYCVRLCRRRYYSSSEQPNTTPDSILPSISENEGGQNSPKSKFAQPQAQYGSASSSMEDMQRAMMQLQTNTDQTIKMLRERIQSVEHSASFRERDLQELMAAKESANRHKIAELESQLLDLDRLKKTNIELTKSLTQANAQIQQQNTEMQTKLPQSSSGQFKYQKENMILSEQLRQKESLIKTLTAQQQSPSKVILDCDHPAEVHRLSHTFPALPPNALVNIDHTIKPEDKETFFMAMECIQRGSSVPFIGSGLSAHLGFPVCAAAVFQIWCEVEGDQLLPNVHTTSSPTPKIFVPRQLPQQQSFQQLRDMLLEFCMSCKTELARMRTSISCGDVVLLEWIVASIRSWEAQVTSQLDKLQQTVTNPLINSNIAALASEWTSFTSHRYLFPSLNATSATSASQLWGNLRRFIMIEGFEKWKGANVVQQKVCIIHALLPHFASLDVLEAKLRGVMLRQMIDFLSMNGVHPSIVDTVAAKLLSAQPLSVEEHNNMDSIVEKLLVWHDVVSSGPWHSWISTCRDGLFEAATANTNSNKVFHTDEQQTSSFIKHLVSSHQQVPTSKAFWKLCEDLSSSTSLLSELSPTVISALNVVFSRFNLLFFGINVLDCSFTRMLDLIIASNPYNAATMGPHYWIVGCEYITEEEIATLKSKYNIHVIRPHSSKNYHQWFFTMAAFCSADHRDYSSLPVTHLTTQVKGKDAQISLHIQYGRWKDFIGHVTSVGIAVTLDQYGAVSKSDIDSFMQSLGISNQLSSTIKFPDECITCPARDILPFVNLNLPDSTWFVQCSKSSKHIFDATVAFLFASCSQALENPATTGIHVALELLSSSSSTPALSAMCSAIGYFIDSACPSVPIDISILLSSQNALSLLTNISTGRIRPLEIMQRGARGAMEVYVHSPFVSRVHLPIDAEHRSELGSLNISEGSHVAAI